LRRRAGSRGGEVKMAWLIYPLFAVTALYGAVGLIFISSLVGLGGRRL
jgi:hypothetical protein